MATVVKPKMRTKKYYEWSDIQEYLKKKHSIDSRKHGQDLWLYLGERVEVSNGIIHPCYISDWIAVAGDEDSWVCPILRIILKEFCKRDGSVNIRFYW